jgi:hypothetical protein
LKEIQLTSGEVAIVDDEDYERVSAVKWRAGSGRPVVHWIRKINRRGEKTTTYIGLSRFIMEPPLDMDVDHINHNQLDNRRCNLRICTTSENTRNKRKTNNKCTSRYKGVCWCKQRSKWRVTINDENRRQHHVGFFTNEDDAAMAYDMEAHGLFGEFACTNM